MAEKLYDYNYGQEVTVTVKNVIDPAKNKACDAGTPVQKVEMPFSEVEKCPCIKWEYIFEADGSFKKTTDGKDNLVLAHLKFKNSDRIVPAYRVANAKTLKAGESMKFKTDRKDEIVFYEKVAKAFAGELEVTFEPAVATEVVAEETNA